MSKLLMSHIRLNLLQKNLVHEVKWLQWTLHMLKLSDLKLTLNLSMSKHPYQMIPLQLSQIIKIVLNVHKLAKMKLHEY